MSDDGSVGSGGSGEGTTVTDLLLNATDDRSFRELAHWENISNVEGSLLATVNKGTSVKALGCDEGLFAELVTVWITEDDTGKRGAAKGSTSFGNPFSSSIKRDVPAGVMDDFLDDAANVTVPFGKVEGT